VVKLLLDQGATLDHKNQYGELTALSSAMQANYEAVVKLLLDKGVISGNTGT
jgi:ankyrin repeat protein